MGKTTGKIIKTDTLAKIKRGDSTPPTSGRFIDLIRETASKAQKATSEKARHDQEEAKKQIADAICKIAPEFLEHAKTEIMAAAQKGDKEKYVQLYYGERSIPGWAYPVATEVKSQLEKEGFKVEIKFDRGEAPFGSDPMYDYTAFSGGLQVSGW
jgi:hypothetical protein